jgi:hypothetical protein
MSPLQVARFEPNDALMWDRVVAASPQGALQHRRRFLDYHGERFSDRSLVVRQDEVVAAVYSAADSPASPGEVVSHPGAAYGGLVLAPGVPVSEVPGIVDGIIGHYQQEGVHHIVVRPPWHWTQRRPDEVFTHELLRRGATAHAWQLVSVVDLSEPLSLGSRRRRMLKRGTSRLSVSWDVQHLPPYWEILEERLLMSHSVKPTHSLDEAKDLAARFPDNIQLATAWEGRQIVGGALIINESTYQHLQYIAATDAGRDAGATDVVVVAAAERARSEGVKSLSLGSSVEPHDHSVNAGLLDFKSEFGASAFAVPRLILDLTRDEPPETCRVRA